MIRIPPSVNSFFSNHWPKYPQSIIMQDYLIGYIVRRNLRMILIPNKLKVLIFNISMLHIGCIIAFIPKSFYIVSSPLFVGEGT